MWFPLFILASSVFMSLQCLISTLTQGGEGGHFFRLTCSVVMGGGRHTANKYQWPVWWVLAVTRPCWVCTRSRRFPRLHCSGFRLLCRERALCSKHFPGLSHSGSGSRVLHKGADSVGPAFSAFPGPSSPGNQVLGEHTLPGCRASYHLPGPSHSNSWLAVGTPSPVCHGSLLGSWSLAATLPVDVNHPESQEILGSNWKPACSLVEHAVSGAEFAPGCCLSPCLWGWAGPQPVSSPLVFIQSSVLWVDPTVP